ncbi:MAG: hypothetical protein NVS2B11_05450 [Acetobacteraceae bacterium]
MTPAILKLIGAVTPTAETPRGILQAAIEAAAEATAAAADAGRLASRALAIADGARSALSRFSKLGDKVAAHRAELIRAGAEDGPSHLPSELAAERLAQTDAATDLADASAAHQRLQAEHHTAAAAAERAARAVQAAAVRVMAIEAEALRVHLVEIEAEAGELRALLSSYASIWSSADTEAFHPVSWPIEQLRYDAQAPGLVGMARPQSGWTTLAARWITLRKALAANANATLHD